MLDGFGAQTITMFTLDRPGRKLSSNYARNAVVGPVTVAVTVVSVVTSLSAVIASMCRAESVG